MMRHDKRIRTGGAIVALLTLAALVSPAAAKIPTIDAGANMKAAEQLQTLKNQAKQLTDMRSLMEEQLSAFGSFGTMGDLFGGAAFANTGSKSDFYTNMAKFGFDMCAINLCTGGANPIGTTDIDEARDWVTKNLFSSKPLDPSERRDLDEIRRRAVIYAATNGVALSTVVHNELVGAGDQADTLEKIVESSQNLRGDIRANSAIALAAYKIEVQKLATLMAMLNVESSTAIAGVSHYHESGGNSFADAFIDGDYAPNDPSRRIEVTVPKKGSATGGSGLGGSLFGATSGASVSPASPALNSAGLQDIGSIVGSKDPVGSFLKQIDSGKRPDIRPEDITINAVVADGVELATRVSAQNGITGYQNALNSMKKGISAGTPSGHAELILAAAQAYARAEGRTELALTLDRARIAVAGGAASSSADFAQAVLKDLKANGVQQSYLSYLERSLYDLKAGKGSSQTLIMDASALLSAYGPDRSANATQTLQVDPAKAATIDMQRIIAGVIQAIGTAEKKPELIAIAEGIRAVKPADLTALRQAATRRGAAATPGNTR